MYCFSPALGFFFNSLRYGNFNLQRREVDKDYLKRNKQNLTTIEKDSVTTESAKWNMEPKLCNKANCVLIKPRSPVKDKKKQNKNDHQDWAANTSYEQ